MKRVTGDNRETNSGAKSVILVFSFGCCCSFVFQELPKIQILGEKNFHLLSETTGSNDTYENE